MNRRTRYARRRGRSAPLLVLTDDREPGEGIALAVKLVYRYRSELAPFVLAGVETGTGFWLHATHPTWWFGLAVATTVVSTLVALVPGRWFANARSGPVLSRPIERVYTALVTVVTGGWLTAATWLGPGMRPLPLVGFVAGVTVAVPWWMHRRRRDKVRVERTMAAWPDIADKIGLPDSKIRSVLVAPWGFLARIALRKGHTYATAANAVPAIESGLGTRSGAVRVEPDEKRADHVTLRVVERDPHAAPIPWPETAKTGYAAETPLTDTITRPVELGVFEDGAPVRLPLLGRHVLIGGATGSGKSGVANVLLAGLTRCTDVAVWGIDLKGGMELGPWRSCLDQLATTPGEAVEMLRNGVDQLDGRASVLAVQGQRAWQPKPERPALVIVVDEYAELPDTAHRYADSIARRGRAPAVQLVVATQRPTQKAMGQSAVRSQMDIRICLRVRERKDTDLILGQGMANAGWHPHTLDKPGTFLIAAAEHGMPRRARGYLLTDRNVADVAARHARTRPVLPVFTHNHTETSGTGDGTGTATNRPATRRAPDAKSGVTGPETALWAALRTAPADGVSVGELVTTTGMSRPWVYLRLREHVRAGRVESVDRGRWRATDPHRDRSPTTDPKPGEG